MASSSPISPRGKRARLMFAYARPAIDAAMSGSLMLQTVLGLDAAAIGDGNGRCGRGTAAVSGSYPYATPAYSLRLRRSISGKNRQGMV